MLHVIVASQNPVKLNAAGLAFGEMFREVQVELEGVSVPSDVADQPMTDAETYVGAKNRAEHARAAKPGADFWVGIEGGLEERNGEMEAFAWIIVIDKGGKLGKGRTATFFLPEAVAKLIREGKELGEADDIVFARSNSKQENGAVGILTENAIDRTRFYSAAAILALIPFKNPSLY